MIQELLGGVLEERKIISFPAGGVPADHNPFNSLLSSSGAGISTSPSSSSSSVQLSASSSPSKTTTTEPPPPQQNLRCPRCDSSNTKFCYYNNYNLTQPRHFCKTCRRYWTKGGALRNVPIGGGCRKAKPAATNSSGATTAVGKAIGGGIKAKPIASLDPIVRAGIEHELMLAAAAAPPSTSHLLALLRSSSGGGGGLLNSNSIRLKEEDGQLGLQMATTESSLTLDPLGMGSLWRISDVPIPYLQQPFPLQQNHATFGDVAAPAASSGGIQELYQNLRSPAFTNYWNDHLAMSNGWSVPVCSSTAATMATGNGVSGGSGAATLEPGLVSGGGGEFGCWNQALSWSDMSTTN